MEHRLAETTRVTTRPHPHLKVLGKGCRNLREEIRGYRGVQIRRPSCRPYAQTSQALAPQTEKNEGRKKIPLYSRPPFCLQSFDTQVLCPRDRLHSSTLNTFKLLTDRQGKESNSFLFLTVCIDSLPLIPRPLLSWILCPRSPSLQAKLGAGFSKPPSCAQVGNSSATRAPMCTKLCLVRPGHRYPNFPTQWS